MEKRPFWARTNRALWVTLLLAVAVITYCVVLWAVKQPHLRDVRGLCDDVQVLAAQQLVLTQEEAEALLREQDTEARHSELKNQLYKHFVADSDYLDEAAVTLDNLLTSERLTSPKPRKAKVASKMLDDDTAQMVMLYEMESDKTSNSYDRTELRISLVCKRVDGVWRIYRLGDVDVWMYGY